MVAQIIPSSGPVQGLRAPESPQRIAAEGRQLQYSAEQIANLGRAVTERFQELEQDEVATESSLRFSEKFNEIQSKPYRSAEEIREMGYDDESLVDEEGNDREEVALWEYAPKVLKAEYDKITDQLAERLSGSGNRQAFRNQRARRGQQMYDELLAAQREAFQQQRIQEKEVAIDRAMMVKDYQLAQSLAMTHPNPEKREILSQRVQTRAITDSFHEAIQSGDPTIMQDQAEYLREGGADGILAEEEQTAWIRQLESSAAQFAQETSTEQLIQWDIARARMDQAVRRGEAGEGDVIALVQQSYELFGKNYFGKEWMSSKFREIEEVRQENLRRSEARQLTIAAVNGIASVDPNDKYIRGAVDDLAMQYIAEMEADPNTGVSDTLDRLVELSASTHYMPEVVRSQFRGVSNPNTPPERLVQQAELYNRMYARAPSLLGQVPDQSKAMLEMVWSLSRGGELNEDAITHIRDVVETTEKDVLERRRGRASQYIQSGAFDDQMKDLIAADGRLDAKFFGIPRLSDRMTLDLETKFETYVSLGMDPDQATEVAYKDVSTYYGPSKINGEWKIMRMAPEAIDPRFTTEQYRADLEDWVKETFEVDDASNIQIQETGNTRFGKMPEYQVFSVDEEGMPTVERDQFGRLVTWTPRMDKIAAQARNNEIANAEDERERLIKREETRKEHESLQRPTRVPESDDQMQRAGRTRILNSIGNQ